MFILFRKCSVIVTYLNLFFIITFIIIWNVLYYTIFIKYLFHSSPMHGMMEIIDNKSSSISIVRRTCVIDYKRYNKLEFQT